MYSDEEIDLILTIGASALFWIAKYEDKKSIVVIGISIEKITYKFNC